MSIYTTQLRFICESLADYSESQGGNNVLNVINKSSGKIFDFDFPIFDESYKGVLCRKILMHYYTREIGLETYGLWKLKLQTKMNEIMPYYNQLYKSALIEFNPLYDADYTKEHTGSDAGKNSEKTGGNNSEDSEYSDSRSSTNWDVYSDTPQGALANVANETYLTNARKVTNSASGSGSGSREGEYSGERNGEFANTNEYVEHVFGKMPGANMSKYIIDFRKTFLNIDMMVIDELSDLFMKLW